MFLIIAIWILLLAFFFTTLIRKAGLHLKYNKILKPDKYYKYNNGFEYLLSFSVKRYLIFIPVIFRNKRTENENEELQETGKKLVIMALIYSIAIAINFGFLYYLIRYYFE